MIPIWQVPRLDSGHRAGSRVSRRFRLAIASLLLPTISALALSLVARAAVGPVTACTSQNAMPLRLGVLVSVRGKEDCAYVYARVRLVLGDRVTIRAIAGEGRISVTFRPDRQDADQQSNPTDCAIDSLVAFQAREASCTIAVRGRYLVQVQGTYDGTRDSWGKVGVWTKHARNRRQLVQGSCEPFRRPPVIGFQVLEYRDPVVACAALLEKGSPYPAAQRWRLNVAKSRLSTLRLKWTSTTVTDGSRSDVAEIRVYTPGTDITDYDPVFNNPRLVCRAVLDNDVKQASTLCSFPRGGNYIVVAPFSEGLTNVSDAVSFRFS
jgi:hypothetical protein